MNWTNEELLRLPVKDGFYLRGNEMSRIETFVAAAFAFLITMVMVAGNDIPQDVDSFRIAVLNIPAFAICALQIIWIWYEHAVWSRRYGLEDAWTIFLSGLLIVVVLVYVYPLKAMAAGFFHWMSGRYFPSSMSVQSIEDIRFLFCFFSGGFLALSFILWQMQTLVLKRAKELSLTSSEYYHSQTQAFAWTIMMFTSFVSIILAYFLEGRSIAWAGLIYMHLGVTLTLYHRFRFNKAPQVD